MLRTLFSSVANNEIEFQTFHANQRELPNRIQPNELLHLICNHAEDEPEEMKQKAIESIRTKEHQGAKVAKWILSLLK